MPEVVRATALDSGRFEGWVPLTAAPGVEAEVAAATRGEQEWRIQPGRELVERVECPLRKRNATSGALGFGIAGQDAVSAAALNGDSTPDPVDVAPFERDPLVCPQSRFGREDDERPIDRAEFYREPVDLVSSERM